MVLLIVVGALLVAAIVAMVFVLRGRSGAPAKPVDSPHPARRKSDREPSSGPPVRARQPGEISSQDLSDAIHRQRQKAGRLVAGHVQLIDMHALLEAAPAGSNLTPAKALQIAEAVTRQMIRSTDTVVVMRPDGIAILFDGATKSDAETRSRDIADKVTEALGHLGGGEQFMAEGFGYELDDVLEGATIDSIDDLTRFVRIAHQSYVQKQRGIAKQFASQIELRWEPILDSRSRTLFGFEIRVFRKAPGSSSHEDASFQDMDPASGSEFDCVVLEKLAMVGPKITGGQGDVRLLLPLRTEGLVNPLYFENVAETLEKLGSNLVRQVVPVLSAPTSRTKHTLAKVITSIKVKLPEVAIRINSPKSDLPGLSEKGVTIAVLDRVEDRFKDPAKAISAFAGLARSEKIMPVVLGVGDSIGDVKEPVAYSGLG